MSSSKHTASFGLVLGGKLSLKGGGGEGGLDGIRKKKKKKKKRDHPADGAAGGSDSELEVPEWSDTPLPGTGELTSSGVVVMGHGTAFDRELSVGDSLLVTVTDRYRNTTVDESRVVNMVLGKGSLNLTQPFSCDVSAPISFMFVRKAPDMEALRAERDAKKARAARADQASKEVTYKVYKNSTGTWNSWKTVTERVAEGVTREDMLDKRCKMKSDHHCK
ncbi:hypothetical protein EMIHUDRAFT_423564 [Emiliania huxleyi CCMP1516]|uniref:Uncharacterized protein n=2 Tax=Emiliania huxleyi TaxID=2903 RepID=A0A0D3KE52_EMIH1|nr:hypothetical protein EMIHUDRAFT_435024 [Emiliania huxleyi CCMP1516]XP_005786466.1 hypothetical protein EMIHUDRAFT_423564 [Emiliania huxleyi CCMP1516]EOD26332.1 hypothetical protein EMIHUDRAFT_435024 [Emiliania huxleyi CCMP1516]EOD34037.1 hypothetical protein EMIHUDRAFT_423564 [Emiliania huxleyi CCMP1516]|mmetsp:Transcript_3305/g.9689  ORF Transcript_3305/g.9689 Transcript_3305/m.9689 type:complete len:220 (-) Transcript_3305:124-783(-)|eukprot:XP_005778761.1 hypothetical protein EMIHUDRAFT_435024 [Emiliania huxleyi CCMP1516]